MTITEAAIIFATVALVAAAAAFITRAELLNKLDRLTLREREEKAKEEPCPKP